MAIRAYAPGWVDYNMGSYLNVTATAYSGVTFYVASGTMTGTIKIVKKG